MEKKRQLDALQQPHNKKRRKQSRPIRISTPNDVEEGEVSSSGSVQPSLGPPAPYPPLLPSLLSFPPHFLLPMLPSSTQTPPRIFNLEAYCEICSKEFCNKYFLKTHKANRHGIYVQTGDTPPPSSTTPLPPAAQPQLEVPIIDKEEARFSDTKKVVNSDKKKHKVSPCSSPSSVLELPPLSPGRLRRLGVINADAFCQICSKEYCNKYFLKTHKLKRHGILIPDLDDIPCTKGTNIQTSPLNLALHATCSNSSDSGGVPKHENSDLTKQEAPSPKPADDLSEDLQKLQTMLLQLNALNGTSVSCEVVTSENGADETPSPPPPPPVDPEYPEPPQQGDTDDTNTSAPLSTSCYCDICNKELCNKYFKKVHMQKMHGIEIKDNALSGGVPCDICHKQLCSKYFVRVHKQNTHGIVDLSTTPSTPTRTSSPPPPLLPQDKEVADLSHRYYTHFNVVCPLCSRRFRSAKWLKAHLINDHADAGVELARELEPKPNKSSKSDEEKCELGESSSSAGVLSNLLGDDRYHCSYCSFSTPVLSLLFVHERSHTGLPSGLTCHLCFKTFGSSELLTRHVRTHQLAGLPISDVPEAYQVTQDEPEPSRYQLEPEPGLGDDPQEDKTAGRYRCSQCQQRFRTRDLWSAHVHSHSESPPFCCPVCPFTSDLLATFKKHVKNEHVDGALWRSLAQVEVSRTLQDAARETQVAATYAVPQGGADKFLMQAFLLEAELSNHGTFVPSLVFLPVREKVSGTLTVSFNLTPA